MGLSDEQVEQLKKSVVNTMPLGRMGNADEIAKGVAFLASDDSSYITGQPHIGPPTPEPHRQPQIGPSVPTTIGGEMSIPAGAKLVQGIQWHPYAGSAPCKVGNLGSGPTRDTCRYQADLTSLYSGDYIISATVDVGGFSQGAEHHGGNCTETGQGPKNQGKGSCGARLEFTSGGPGSHKGACCGFSFCINSTES